jgi:hypothetical protein
MKTLGGFIRKRRRELGLFGREVVAAVRKADGTPISIPYLVDLEHDRRKPSDPVLNQLATVRWRVRSVDALRARSGSGRDQLPSLRLAGPAPAGGGARNDP